MRNKIRTVLTITKIWKQHKENNDNKNNNKNGNNSLHNNNTLKVY